MTAAHPNAILYTRAGHVWRMNPDGTGATELVAAYPGSPTAWSPDHARFAYVRKAKSGATIWTASATGRRARQLRYSGPWKGWAYGHVDPTGLAWSPNGRYIAYADTRRQGAVLRRDYLVVIDLKRHTSRVLARATNILEQILGLRYMPDGKQLLEWEDVALVGVMRLISVSNGQAGPRIDDSDSILSADVSPDGKRLACAIRNVDTGEYSLKVMSIDGSGQTVLANSAYDDPFVYGAPLWSPDGAQIVVARADSTTGASRMTIMNADGTTARRLGVGKPTSWR